MANKGGQYVMSSGKRIPRAEFEKIEKPQPKKAAAKTESEVNDAVS
ncbi:hypothetical protein [Oceanospirillum maris]|jgi:hypothetical protein|nr:hypothetical protein [Oceanospirillum maris]